MIILLRIFAKIKRDSMKALLLAGPIVLIFVVIFGAFGAHALKNILSSYGVSIYEKATIYQLFHGLALLVLPLLVNQSIMSATNAKLIMLTMLAGIVIFSGSLYILAITNIKWFGAITPIGGTLLILAWALWIKAIMRSTVP
jgi:uncharacterized membrane protein YgdD (TMEM256/DUF423 family)